MLINIARTVSYNSSLRSALLKRNAQITLLSVCRRHKRSGSAAPSDLHSEQLTVLTDDGSTIVCWHPEKDFPYECSKPMPLLEPSIREGDSILKLQYRVDNANRYNPDGPNMKELMKLTFTNKHIWYPRTKKELHPAPPPDREGL